MLPLKFKIYYHLHMACDLLDDGATNGVVP